MVEKEGEEEDLEDGQEGGETGVETIATNPWQVKQGTRFLCPICNYTQKTESQIRNHMQVHDDKDAVSMNLCNICSFQTNNIDQLKPTVDNKHQEVKHV